MSAAATPAGFLVPDTLHSPFLLKPLSIKNMFKKGKKKNQSQKIHGIDAPGGWQQKLVPPPSARGRVGFDPKSSSPETVGASSTQKLLFPAVAAAPRPLELSRKPKA